MLGTDAVVDAPDSALDIGDQDMDPLQNFLNVFLPGMGFQKLIGSVAHRLQHCFPTAQGVLGRFTLGDVPGYPQNSDGLIVGVTDKTGFHLGLDMVPFLWTLSNSRTQYPSWSDKPLFSLAISSWKTSGARAREARGRNSPTFVSGISSGVKPGAR
jgi:hypothetical protein